MTCSNYLPFLFHFKIKASKNIYHWMHFFLPFNWPRVHHVTCNCLQIMVCSCVVPSKLVLLRIIFCSCVTGTKFSREKWQIASLSCQEVIKIWKQSWWSNDKTIIELGYHKISWFASVSQINYLPKPKALTNQWQLATDKSRYFAQPRPTQQKLCRKEATMQFRIQNGIMNNG